MKISISSALLLFLASANALDKIVIKGSKFFNLNSKDQFFIKGLAYQPEKNEPDPANQDPLADPVACKRDAPIFKDLGVNTIRVYQTDSSKNHDECMKILSDAGIYVVLDIATSNKAVNRYTPFWDTALFSDFRAKVDAFVKYDNVIGFIAGNEVANDKNTTPSAAFVKAAIRDIKKYLATNNHNYPVGYASNDDPDIRDSLRDYFNCGDSSVQADFYGVNLYSWCGPDATLSSTGYDKVVQEYQNYSIPVILSEYGCNSVRPRVFGETTALYSSDMTSVFSGGFMYMYSQEPNDYGLVDVSYGVSSLTKLADYDHFKKALTSVSPKGISMNSYSPSSNPSTCPPVTDTWRVSSPALPPTPSSDTCECMLSSLSCIINSSSSAGVSPADATNLTNNLCGSGSGKTDCSDVQYDTSTGKYGAFQFCDANSRYAYIISNSNSCSSSNLPLTQQTPKISGTSSCTNKKNDVGSNAANSVNEHKRVEAETSSEHAHFTEPYLIPDKSVLERPAAKRVKGPELASKNAVHQQCDNKQFGDCCVVPREARESTADEEGEDRQVDDRLQAAREPEHSRRNPKRDLGAVRTYEVGERVELLAEEAGRVVHARDLTVEEVEEDADGDECEADMEEDDALRDERAHGEHDAHGAADAVAERQEIRRRERAHH
ncbi:Protein EPD1 [Smittium culicis]|uniref:1,3-beta-glucanosyltransferase n=1 Tax=Smittium culicis TaxID=133412 RepID=A0A1R1XCT5_9FUNG|nr:Protein EPD1 [Smittium culicis]